MIQNRTISSTHIFSPRYNHRTGTGRDSPDMVFNLDNDGAAEDNAANRVQAVRAANCIKILGKGVIRVVQRVDDARENNNLGEGTNDVAAIRRLELYLNGGQIILDSHNFISKTD